MKRRCKQPACNTMSVTRGWCAMHYKRWQLWGDPSAASRKIAALALSAVLVACAAVPVVAEPVACTTPDDMVLMPRSLRDDAMRGIKELDEALDTCVKNLVKCRVRNNCS